MDYAREIMGVGTITMAHEKIVDRALTAYNAIKQDYTKYGFTEAEWTAMANAVQAAKTRIVRLKIENSNYAVRTLQSKIDSLPSEFDESVRSLMDEITEDMARLTIDERGILDLTKYNALYEAYNPSETPGTKPPSEEDPKKDDDSGCSCSLTGAASSMAASALVLIFVLSAIPLSKRFGKSTSAEKTDKGDKN